VPRDLLGFSGKEKQEKTSGIWEKQGGVDFKKKKKTRGNQRKETPTKKTREHGIEVGPVFLLSWENRFLGEEFTTEKQDERTSYTTWSSNSRLYHLFNFPWQLSKVILKKM
jgi:hypothetical protein